MRTPHPIPYQGSKRKLAPHILRHMPACVERLVEPFAGSAALSIAAAQHRRAGRFWLNDINRPLMALWEAIIERPDALADGYARLWHAQQGRERAFYDEVRARFNRTHQPADLLYLLARCVKASVRYNARGEFNQSPDNRRKGRHPRAMRADILAVAHLLGGRTTLTASDYREVFARATPRDLLYLDPPYQGVSRSNDPRYMAGVPFGELVAALDDLNRRGVPYLLSYDGRSGAKRYGQAMPPELGLLRLELDAGRSSQATLLGKSARTYEALYLSPALVAALKKAPAQTLLHRVPTQPRLL